MHECVRTSCNLCTISNCSSWLRLATSPSASSVAPEPEREREFWDVIYLDGKGNCIKRYIRRVWHRGKLIWFEYSLLSFDCWMDEIIVKYPLVLFVLNFIFYFFIFIFRDKNGEDSNAGGLNNAVMQLRKVRETQFKRITRRREKKTLTIICLSSIIWLCVHTNNFSNISIYVFFFRCAITPIYSSTTTTWMRTWSDQVGNSNYWIECCQNWRLRDTG